MKATNRYSQLGVNELRLQVERMQPLFKAGSLDISIQKEYLLMKAELLRRQQAELRLDTEQRELF